jgi:predicted small metal-binding protein
MKKEDLCRVARALKIKKLNPNSTAAEVERRILEHVKRERGCTSPLRKKRSTVQAFLESKGSSGHALKAMLSQNWTLRQWQSIWEQYKDLGGHWMPWYVEKEGWKARAVKTPWAGAPPALWSTREKAIKHVRTPGFPSKVDKTVKHAKTATGLTNTSSKAVASKKRTSSRLSR